MGFNIGEKFDELWILLAERLENQGSESDVDANAPGSSALLVHRPSKDAAVDNGMDAVSGKETLDAVASVPKPSPQEELSVPAVLTEPARSEEPSKARPLDQKAFERLDKIRYFSSWKGEEGEREANSAKTLFNEEYPSNEDSAEQAVKKGKSDLISFNRAHKLGRQQKSESAIRELIESLPLDNPRSVTTRIWKQYDRGLTVAKRFTREQKRRRSGKPLSTLKPRVMVADTALPQDSARNQPEAGRESNRMDLHPNDIRGLKPCEKWELVIDETGAVFDDNAVEANPKQVGRFVGIFIPAARKVVPPLQPGWHAADVRDPAEIDRVMQSLLDAPVGVFGIDVRSVPVTPGERWMDGVALLIDWVLRLMPVESPCELQVSIEQRGVFNRQQPWDVVRRDCLRRLALAFPQRAARVNLQIDAIAKTESGFDGYADAVAFTWAQTSESSKARLRQSGLLGTCLLDSNRGGDARSMLNAWDAFAQGVHLPPETWWNLLCSPDAGNQAALLAQLLTLVGEEARAETQVWQAYLHEVKMRMAAGPIDLRRMGAAIDWLQTYAPPAHSILPPLRLVWLTVQLARANHLGATEKTWQNELRTLGDRLFDEAAPLVCHADLHLAVACTNRFDFSGAERALSRWQDVPPAVPGLRYWAQVRSSLGQHAAFQGHAGKAVKLFNEALNAFSRLSDPEARQRDRLQTGAYLAIAMMDDPCESESNVKNVVEGIVGKLPEAAKKLAFGADPADRYAHHLLLRWLVHRGDEEVWQQYISHRDQWDAGGGHPWPLIQLYRGILLRKTDPDAAVKLAIDGAERAFAANQGPTVHFIGACCRAIGAVWGHPWPEADAAMGCLAQELPAIQDRIEDLQACMAKPHQSLLGLLGAMLPFNFR